MSIAVGAMSVGMVSCIVHTAAAPVNVFSSMKIPKWHARLVPLSPPMGASGGNNGAWVKLAYAPTI